MTTAYAERYVDTFGQAWQAELRGFTVGDGTDYPFFGEGPSWLGSGPLREQRTDRPEQHGQVAAGQDLLDSRRLVLPLVVAAADAVTLEDRLAALAAAWQPSAGETVTLLLRTALSAWEMRGRPGRVEIPVTQDHRQGVAYPVVEFDALDPRGYSPTISSATVDLGTTTGGLTYPHGFPHEFGTVTAGLLAAENVGSAPTPPAVTIAAGPAGLTGPVVENLTSGRRIAFDVTLPFGSRLVVDFDERTVMLATSPDLSGAANRADTVSRPSSSWWDLPPGRSDLRFSGAGEGQMTVAWQSAWLL